MRRATHAFKLPKAGWKGSERTRAAYNVDLQTLEAFLDKRGILLLDMTEQNWNEYVEWRKQGPKESFEFSAQNRALSAGIRYLQYLDIEEHPLFEIEKPTGARRPQRTLKLSQFNILLGIVLGGRNPERDTALIRFMWDTGARSFETANALWEHLDIDGRSIDLETKAARRKPRQWETKRFSPETADALAIFRAHLPAGEKIFNFSRDGIYSFFKRLSRKAGFRVSPHDLRRGLVAHMKEKHIADSLGMQQTGIRTHSIYDQYGQAARLQALDGKLW